MARRFILFSPHETLNNNTDRNNNNSKRCCQNLTIRTFLPKNPHFYILLQKPKLRPFGSLLVRGKVSVSWAVVAPPTGQALGGASRAPPSSAGSPRPGIRSYLSLCLCHSFHKENEMSPVAISLKSEKKKKNRLGLQEKWERACFFMEVKNILTYLLNEPRLCPSRRPSEFAALCSRLPNIVPCQLVK